MMAKKSYLKRRAFMQNFITASLKRDDATKERKPVKVRGKEESL